MLARRAASGVRRFASKVPGEAQPPAASASHVIHVIDTDITSTNDGASATADASSSSPDASSSISDAAQAPTATAAANDGAPSSSSLPPWLHRALQHWDRESGTHEILRLKRRVESSSAAFDATQKQVAAARAKLDDALHAFEEGQVAHAQLLQSRDKWTPAQALEFAKLLETEVVIRKELEGAKKELGTLEAEQLRLMHGYMNNLRRRYQEEQLWQDRWRIYSTFGTWGLIVLNSFVFLASQYLWRVREARRSEEVRGLLRQSLAANEGARRAAEATQEHMQGRVEREGKMAEEQKVVSTETVVSPPKQEGAETIIGEDAPCAGNERVEEGAKEGAAAEEQADDSDEDRLPSHIDWTRIRQLTRNVDWSRIRPSAGSVDWSRIRQYARDASKKLRIERERIDVPSAVLGASATGLAWLLVAVMSSRRGA
ncbi:hypothetical protein ACHAXT_007962 [Thalassiosira profunda]